LDHEVVVPSNQEEELGKLKRAGEEGFEDAKEGL